jgi:hypothetical protein
MSTVVLAQAAEAPQWAACLAGGRECCWPTQTGQACPSGLHTAAAAGEEGWRCWLGKAAIMRHSLRIFWRTYLAAIVHRRRGATVVVRRVIITMPMHASSLNAMLGRIGGPPRRRPCACAMRSSIRRALRKARPRPYPWPWPWSLLDLPVGWHRLVVVARSDGDMLLGWCVWMECDGRTTGMKAGRRQAEEENGRG